MELETERFASRQRLALSIGAVEPGTAAVIGNAIGLGIGMRPPADTIPRLDRLHGKAVLDQGSGRGKPGRPGADHYCIQHRHQPRLSEDMGRG